MAVPPSFLAVVTGHCSMAPSAGPEVYARVNAGACLFLVSHPDPELAREAKRIQVKSLTRDAGNSHIYLYLSLSLGPAGLEE